MKEPTAGQTTFTAMRDATREDYQIIGKNYDQNSFDPHYENLPLEAFEPAVRKLFAAPRRSIYLNDETPRVGAG